MSPFQTGRYESYKLQRPAAYLRVYQSLFLSSSIYYIL